MAGEQPKQYATLAGHPMLWHAIGAVCVPPVEQVFVVLGAEDHIFPRHDWSRFDGRLQALYCGGESRRDSVYNGLVVALRAMEPDDWVLVHDAARPCLPRKDLEALIRECASDEVGGILAMPVADTVKKVAQDESGALRIDGTEDRSRLWLAQTPQMFRAALLLHALQQTAPKGAGAVTDEASAIEQMGLSPRVVAGSRENLKVTWPEDLAIAEALLARRA
jgi:2-C-methyl-D-erythritol 4-phosphate cytidylyltransferase